jgi:hypothetical protein
MNTTRSTQKNVTMSGAFLLMPSGQRALLSDGMRDLMKVRADGDHARRVAIDRLLGRPATGDPYGRIATLIAAA